MYTMRIDFEAWKRAIKKPDWYLTILPEVTQVIDSIQHDEEKDHCKTQIYDFFEKHLIDGDIVLGDKIGVWDKERMPIDTLVIHHTSNPPGMKPERLSAIELLRLYAPYYANPTEPRDHNIKGLPISSGHVRNGKQVFYPYHWIVRNSGQIERLLHDSEVGWHAGNWNVNCRSIAIVFDNDYETAKPSKAELEAFVHLIKSNYSSILKKRIIGHCEVNTKKTCPSQLFLSTNGKTGWKEDLLELISI